MSGRYSDANSGFDDTYYVNTMSKNNALINTMCILWESWKTSLSITKNNCFQSRTRLQSKSTKTRSKGTPNQQNPIETNSYYTEIILTNKSLATSGNYRKYRIDTITGERYAHIIDPLSGQSLFNNILSASVIADNCIDSDAWATTLMLMNPGSALEMVNKIDGIEMLLLTSKDDQIFPIKSKGWDSNTKWFFLQ